MKRFFRDLGILVIAGFILWLFVPQWFGISASLGRGSPPTKTILQTRLKLPQGFAISVYASDLPGARMLHFTDAGDLLVSLPDSGRVVLLAPNANRNILRASDHLDLLTDLERPHGIDIHDGWLYVAETGSVGRIRFNANTRITQGNFEHIITNLPAGGDHWSKSLHFGPDGMMYVSVGSSCNVCEEQDPRRATILRFQPDGSQAEVYASGLRNTVGFDWHPTTKQLYGVDNGRDLLGDDVPPCELNLIKAGKSYGWPYVHGNKIPDPDYASKNIDMIAQSEAPIFAFGAHTAPLGIRFLDSELLPETWRGRALVALHGSWNRSEKSGYEVVALTFSEQGEVSYQSFIHGFELNNDVIGRPVDIAQGPDGSIYVSDDYTGSIYRVVYTGS